MIYINGLEYNKSDNEYIKTAINKHLEKMDIAVNTSGTTGHPRTIHHTAESIKKISDYNTDFFELESNSKMLTLFSPKGIAFTTMALYPCRNAGCDLFIETKVNKYVERVNYIKPTHTVILPSLYNMLSRHKSWEDLDLSSCEHLGIGSDFTPVGALTDFRMKGAKRAYSIYGSTEVPPLVATTESDNHYTWEGINPNIDIELKNSELFVKWKHQTEWWSSGDLVEETNRGFKLVGRKLNMFKLGECGNRVYPEQVEKVAIELGATRALCRKVNEKCHLYYTGNLNEKALKSTFTFGLIVKEVMKIKVDDNLRKVKRDQCILGY
jgi:acyl-coenzyme A synthetase/AMP-(fatty) acid ligase